MQGLLRSLSAQSAWRKRDSWLFSAAIVTVLAACVFLVGISAVPVTDRDEPRFAQASRQMAQSDALEDWIVPRVGDTIRLKKPPLVYWVQAPFAWIASGGDVSRDAIWMYRLPSAIAALVAALATMWLGRAMFGANTGLLAACLLVVSPVIVTDCHMARADELLLAITTLAMCVGWTLWRTHRLAPETRGGLPLSRVALFWFLIGLGVLAKGPITPFVAGSAAVGLAITRREWRFLWRLRPFCGVVVLSAIALPWLWLAVQSVGFDTLKAAFEKEVLLRAREGAEGHGAPPGFYLVTLVVFFFPGSLLTALGFVRMMKRAFVINRCEGESWWTRIKRHAVSTRGRDAELYLFMWAVPTWLAFELVITKFPHYILPIYPAIALFSARAVLGGMRALTKPLNGGDRFGFGAWMIVGIVLTLAGPMLYLTLLARGLTAPASPSLPALADNGVVMFTLASLACVLAVVLLVRARSCAIRGAFTAAITYAIPATALAEMALFGVWLPNTRWIWNTPRIVGIVAHDSGKSPGAAGFPLIGCVGYVEDSLLWTTHNRMIRLGSSVREDNRAAMLAWCRANPGAYLLLPRASVAEFAAVGVTVGSLEGFNYSSGDEVSHTVLRLNQE